MLISMGPCSFCGGGNNTPCFATYSDGFKCFTCGKTKRTDGATMAYRPMIKASNTEIRLPEHTQNISEFAPSVLKWLYSYYVYDNLIKKYGIAYTQHTEFTTERGLVYRGVGLLLPVFVDNALVFCQQRFFPNKMFITKGDKTTPFVIKCKRKSDITVIVEDYISAIRLGEHVNVVCMFGTSLTYSGVKLLEQSTDNIIVWLDNDEAGHTGADTVASKLSKSLHTNAKYRAFAVRESRTVEVLRTDKQPKDYCDEELKQLLGVSDENIRSGK